MTPPTPGTPDGDEPAAPPDTVHGGQLQALGQSSAAVNNNPGILSTGSDAHITQLNLSPGTLPSPALIPAPDRMDNLPRRHHDVFEGRTADMDRLRTAMASGTPVLCGLGGVGKSTLALHYAHQQRNAFNPIWWITADSPDTVTADLADLTTRLNPHARTTGMTGPQAADWALTWLQTHTGWLLILDNAQDTETVTEVTGRLTTGHHLITSRRATIWHRHAQPLPLDTLLPDDAATVLETITGQTDNPTALRELAAELGNLPLALEQAAAYIRQTAMLADRYLTHLRRQPAHMFATPANGSDPTRTIARIWKLTLDTLTTHTPLTGHILRTLAWLAPDNVPRDLLYDLADDLAIDEALGLLNDYSMITLSPDTITTHRLVQTLTRTPDPTDPHRSPDAIETAHQQAADILCSALPNAPQTNVAGWPQWRILLPHVEALIAATAPAHDTTTTDRILNQTALYLHEQGQIARAITHNARSVQASTRLQGDDHPNTLTTRNNLAYAYQAAGDLDRAICLYERTLADCVRALGDDHPLTHTVSRNLAAAQTAGS